MIPFTVHEILTATAGRLAVAGGQTEHLVVHGPVVTDSRLCGPGGLYVARVGEHSDGHDHVAAAREAGAVLALVEREVADPLPQVVVQDTETAFGLLARDVVEAAGPELTVVAVTGSCGKTSTKDLLAHVLAALGPTVAAQESFNSEIGVPLTVCRTRPDTRYLVVEMGARGLGHLQYLATVAPPDIAVELNVGYAHAGEFGSLEAVQEAKAELVQALAPSGTAVLNLDDPMVAGMWPQAATTGAQVLGFSTAADPAAVVLARDVGLDKQGRAAFELVSRLDGAVGAAHVRLRLHGEHHVSNALAAAAVALRLGLGVDRVADLLSSAQPVSRWRMEVSRRPDGVTVVNDAYNANPDSVRAALKALVSMQGGGRTWAVLGEMLELGAESVRLHDEIGRLAVRLDVSRVIAVGEGARAIHTGAVMEGSWGEESVWVADAEVAFELLRAELAAGDVVLFKSSRDSGLRWLGERVAADHDTPIEGVVVAPEPGRPGSLDAVTTPRHGSTGDPQAPAR